MKQPATATQAAAALEQLKGFIGTAQRRVFVDLAFSGERQFFFDKMVELAGIVALMPATCETDGQGDQAIVHLHYFMGGCDWYITERDGETGQRQAFGKANLGHGAELGYISIVEVLACGAELDLYWAPRMLAEV